MDPLFEDWVLQYAPEIVNPNLAESRFPMIYFPVT